MTRTWARRSSDWYLMMSQKRNSGATFSITLNSGSLKMDSSMHWVSWLIRRAGTKPSRRNLNWQNRKLKNSNRTSLKRPLSKPIQTSKLWTRPRRLWSSRILKSSYNQSEMIKFGTTKDHELDRLVTKNHKHRLVTTGTNKLSFHNYIDTRRLIV